ncbi:hypothetical protein [Aneurinibacillus terranovensis]|uniref:hypothetical protein n=1 Tax=Aneurinibacillus terranovensis TaxID=278991 RepID=UPI0004143E70|nr:hypothetical protein [Aneurinibacillus terranovensis]
MRCDEIYDWIQRDMDYDLEDSEKELLLQHLRKCPDCSLLYNRLKSLSGHLEDLPMVEPPFSIVESIMPELDKLDRARASALHDEQAAALRAVEPGRTSRKRIILYRSLGSVAAAGLLISAIMYGMDKTKTYMNESSFGGTREHVNTGKAVLPPSSSETSGNSVAKNTPPAQKTETNGADAPAANRDKATAGGGSSAGGTAPQETAKADTSNGHQQPNVSAGKEGGTNSPSPHSVQQNTDPASVSPGKTNSTEPSTDSSVAKNTVVGPSLPQGTTVDQSGAHPALEQGDSGAVAESGTSPSPGGPAIASADKDGQTKAASSASAVQPSDKVATIAGIANPEQGKTGAESDRQAAAGKSSYTPPGLPSPGGNYFVSESNNRLLIRDRQGNIVFVTHTWQNTYKVDYYWVDNQKVTYSLEFTGTGNQPDSMPHYWLIDMGKNIELPIYNK